MNKTVNVKITISADIDVADIDTVMKLTHHGEALWEQYPEIERGNPTVTVIVEPVKVEVE